MTEAEQTSSPWIHCPFVVMGISHHSAPIHFLEQTALEKSSLPLALRDLCLRPGVVSGLILSTCNRVEIYALGETRQQVNDSVAQEDNLKNSLKPFFHHWCLQQSKETGQKPLSADLDERVYFKSGPAALEHFFNVSASLDSMIPGESQILGQVKEAYELLLNIERSHPLMDRIVRKAISTAKRVRTETANCPP
jgi:glutamyl-tRNA reductase